MPRQWPCMPIPKIAPFPGDPDLPIQYLITWAHPSPHAKRHLDWYRPRACPALPIYVHPQNCSFTWGSEPTSVCSLLQVRWHLARSAMQLVDFVCLVVCLSVYVTLCFEPTDIWPWPFTRVWAMGHDHGLCRIESQSHRQGQRSEYGRWDLEWGQFQCFLWKFMGERLHVLVKIATLVLAWQAVDAGCL